MGAHAATYTKPCYSTILGMCVISIGSEVTAQNYGCDSRGNINNRLVHLCLLDNMPCYHYRYPYLQILHNFFFLRVEMFSASYDCFARALFKQNCLVMHESTMSFFPSFRWDSTEQCDPFSSEVTTQFVTEEIMIIIYI